MELEEFIDALYAAGWTAPYDAQWTQISGVHAALIARAEAAEAEVARLRADIEAAEFEKLQLYSELADVLTALIGCDGDEGRDTSEYVVRWEAIMGDKWQG